jgi:hypothetical protein
MNKVAKDTSKAAGFRDRIVDLQRVKASDLKVNAKNWRLHPDSQKGAMTGILKEIGYVDALIVRKLPDGSMELLDGHLRQGISGDTMVPVLVTDLDDDEAAKMLLTFDPLTSMAVIDDEKLENLVDEVNLDENAELRRLISSLEDKIEGDERADPASKKEVAGMALQAHEHYDYLVIFASTTHDWNAICDKLGLAPEKRRGRMGICHAIRAEKLLKVLG